MATTLTQPPSSTPPPPTGLKRLFLFQPTDGEFTQRFNDRLEQALGAGMEVVVVQEDSNGRMWYVLHQPNPMTPAPATGP